MSEPPATPYVPRTATNILVLPDHQQPMRDKGTNRPGTEGADKESTHLYLRVVWQEGLPQDLRVERNAAAKLLAELTHALKTDGSH